MSLFKKLLKALLVDFVFFFILFKVTKFLTKMFGGIVIAVLIIAVIGAIGYFGYSNLFVNHLVPNTNTEIVQIDQANKNAAHDNQNTQQNNVGENQTHSNNMNQSNGGQQQNSDGSQTQPTDMDQNANGEQQQNTQQHNSGVIQQQPNDTNQNIKAGQHANNNQVVSNQISSNLQNKETVNKSIVKLNEALRLMSNDPYSPVVATHTDTSNVQAQAHNEDSPSDNQGASQGNTIINIYTNNNGDVNTTPTSSNNSHNSQPQTSGQTDASHNMGITYDPNKMEQLHSGLYKLSLGMTMLQHLDNQIMSQIGNINSNLQDPARYYSNHYNLTVHNKIKLGQAINYINEASNLVNLNPYVGSNGHIYDKERMSQIHQSVFKFAEATALLNQLSDDLSRQMISLSNSIQNHLNNSMASMQNQTNSGTTTTNSQMNNMASIQNQMSNNMTSMQNQMSNNMASMQNQMNNNMTSMQNQMSNNMASMQNQMNNNMTSMQNQMNNSVNNMSNATHNNAANAHVSQGMVSGETFKNLDTRLLINIVIIIFVLGLVLSIIGVASNLLKPETKNELV